jgi:phosphopantothenoylcysteine decarboxylase/phosphopantothenate--cysteine ligase
VTAGPTREHVDPIRYLTNESSGTMGFEVARAAAAQGDHVVLIAGPVELETPSGVTRIDVTSAREMHAAVRDAFKTADALYMVAAVSDWRPRRRRAAKWRKEQGVEVATLELVRNPDILADACRTKNGRLVVGFALETGPGLRRARAKLVEKGADYVVLNDASALGAARTTVDILGSDGSQRRLERRTKRAVARELVRLAPPRG